VNDLRTSLWLTDSSSRQKYQQRHQLNYSKEQMDLTNIYRLCHSTDLYYTFCLESQETFPKFMIF
jgi:hypothetical protein